MTGQLRNEQLLAKTIDLLNQIVERTNEEAEDAETAEDRAFAIKLAVEVAMAAQTLDIVMRTFDLPFIVFEQPSWRDVR